MVTSRLKRSDNRKHMLTFAETDQGSRTFTLDAASYSIGRDPSNSLVLDDEAVSRHHAMLMRVPISNTEFGYRILDGDLVGKASRNGIKVNGAEITAHDLKDGDVITIANVFQVQYLHRVPTTQSLEPLTMKSIKSRPVDSTATVFFPEQDDLSST